MSEQVRVEGVENLVAKLKELGGVTADIRNDAVTAMLRVRAAARDKAPERKSRNKPEGQKLKSNIIVKDETKDGELLVYCGIFSPLVNYAVYVEYGTGIHAENGQGRKDPWIAPMVIDGEDTFRWTEGMHPQPFLRPAWDEKKDEVQKILVQALQARIKALS